MKRPLLPLPGWRLGFRESIRPADPSQQEVLLMGFYLSCAVPTIVVIGSLAW